MARQGVQITARGAPGSIRRTSPDIIRQRHPPGKRLHHLPRGEQLCGMSRRPEITVLPPPEFHGLSRAGGLRAGQRLHLLPQLGSILPRVSPGLGNPEVGASLVAPFHDSQALWILSHPQAARQDLESCVTCHQQNDCLRCHSATSGLRVNPHGPDFDASSMGSRNQAMCALCHLPGAVGGVLMG